MEDHPGSVPDPAEAQSSRELAKRLMPVLAATCVFFTAVVLSSVPEMIVHNQAADSDTMLSILVGVPATALAAIGTYALHRYAQAPEHIPE